MSSLRNETPEDDEDSVRIVIPLSCIARQMHKRFANTINLVSLFIVCPETPSPLVQLNGSSGSGSDVQLLQFAMIEPEGAWYEMGRIIDQSRSQDEIITDDPYAQARRVVVDYGSLGYPSVQRDLGGNGSEKNHDQFICDVLGIPFTADVWSEQYTCRNLIHVNFIFQSGKHVCIIP